MRYVALVQNSSDAGREIVDNTKRNGGQSGQLCAENPWTGVALARQGVVLGVLLRNVNPYE